MSNPGLVWRSPYRRRSPRHWTTSQGYIEIVYSPECTRSRRVPRSEKGGFELLAVSLPMPFFGFGFKFLRIGHKPLKHRNGLSFP